MSRLTVIACVALLCADAYEYSVPVRTRILSERTRVMAGSEINLPCDVDGYPLPAVHWTKDGSVLDNNERITITEARLTVLRANSNDSGVYGCHAANQYSQHYSTIAIRVEAACALPIDRGSGNNYTVNWFYDMDYGGCSRFWYTGSGGNGNRFGSQAECEDVCVHPSPKDACKLPRVKGVCTGYIIRWYYDSEREQCSQFEYSGCLGNSNNFESRQLCQNQCEPERTKE